MGLEGKKMTVHEVAKLTGITNRTLHYYDEILFFKEIWLSLKEIKLLLTSLPYNRDEALEHHLKILDLKRKRIDRLICLVNDTLAGKHDFSFEAFSNFFPNILKKNAQISGMD